MVLAKIGPRHPTCSKCDSKGQTGIISNKMVSNRLICLRCSTEFSMEEIK